MGRRYVHGGGERGCGGHRGRTGDEGVAVSRWAVENEIAVGRAVAAEGAGGRATRVLLGPGEP